MTKSLAHNKLLTDNVLVFLDTWKVHWRYQFAFVMFEPVLVMYLMAKMNSNIDRIADHYLKINKSN